MKKTSKKSADKSWTKELETARKLSAAAKKAWRTRRANAAAAAKKSKRSR